MVVSEDQRSMYISQDRGVTWIKHELPDSNFNPLKDIEFSSESPSRMSLFTTTGTVREREREKVMLYDISSQYLFDP